MPTLRQMPEIYLRGSLANITMANLTQEQRDQLDDIIKFVASHPEMVKHRSQIIKQFSLTIGGDYQSDHAAAELEYNIAIWRGAVSLLYHKEYTFECTICKSKTYKTQRGKYKNIDRRHINCPNCNHTIVDGYPIDYDSYRQSLNTKSPGKIESPIMAIPGQKKYDEPEKILQDPKQLKKFFGEFAWNYFRQHLKENRRTEHRKSPQLVSGRADHVIAEELSAICNQMSIEYHSVYNSDHYIFSILTLQTSPEFTVEFVRLIRKGSDHNVSVTVDNNSIIIKALPDAEEIETLLVKPEHVNFQDSQQGITDGENSSALDQVDYRFVEGQKMAGEDHISMVELSDLLQAVRRALPVGICQDVYDILCQKGETYDGFSDRFGLGEARNNHIAEYLGITPRAVKEYKERIQVICMSHGLTP